ncbi:hypothetical protein RclHR1_00330005 [Rhizophagus clarus]|uniref:Protein kinase domain-containing protein n=1 Tax=Rhizophagus clarus TaxID=94130 RepID=A0A2Z6S3N8_9GLOM|nr:hypothetical protein RclHR1_00330005 [Rhizophagus clarus]
MELVNTNNENSFDPTPRLKSSPIPIKFISFNGSDENCVYCGEKYIEALFSREYIDNYYRLKYYKQKYCKKCLSSYIDDITDNNMYLDVDIYTMDSECSEHEISKTKVPQCIQECCRNCLRILCFKQIDGYLISRYNVNAEFYTQYDKVIESEKDCKLCGKSLYQGTDEYIMRQIKLCSDCYLISSGLIESTLTKEQISILYLPWWANFSSCNACYSRLTFASDCQKYCTNCLIFYIGCRHCLTTNIIFGLAGQSQCKKCKRISIIINKSEFNDLDDFLLDNVVTHNNLKLTEFVNITKKIDKYFIKPYILKDFFTKKNKIRIINWIPYSRFTNVEKMTKGGYGIIYKVTWLSNNKTVILKRFENSKNNGKYFLNELKSFQHCLIEYDSHIIKTYGFTKDPELEDYILVLEYASGGDLHKYLQKNFTKVTWNKQKPEILWDISMGLEHIHKKKFIHRDFHSGNILLGNYQWKVADLGLSQSLINDTSSNNEIYGVIPYIAPEIFTGSSFSKEADVYSLEDTPECYANLMKSCWDPDPKKRPSISKIRNTFSRWLFFGRKNSKYNEIFDQAEAKRKKLIELKMIGPEFAENRHSEAIYTSRPLSALISKCSSVYSSSTISFDSKYTKLENNTDTKSLSSQNFNSTIRNFSTTLNYNYISTELEFDIEIGSSSSRNLTSIIQKFSMSLKKRRNEIFFNEETHDNESETGLKLVPTIHRTNLQM